MRAGALVIVDIRGQDAAQMALDVIETLAANRTNHALDVGVVPRLHQSGKRRFSGRVAIPLGNARLRRALWMPVLVAVRLNPWLRAYYWRLRRPANGQRS